MHVVLRRTMGGRQAGDTIDVTPSEAEWLTTRGYADHTTTGTEDTGHGDTGEADSPPARTATRGRGKR